MKIIKDKIGITDLKEMALKMHGNLVKIMVDIEKNIIAVDAPMHSDLLELLIKEENSEPKNLWGINIHPDKGGDDFIEFDSMMNFKPALENRSRNVEDSAIREKIINIVSKIVVQ